METIYTLEGWVKEAINNEQADILQQFCKNAVGEAGRKALVELAELYFDFWTGYCRQLETDNITAVYITVYANVMSSDGLLCKLQGQGRNRIQEGGKDSPASRQDTLYALLKGGIQHCNGEKTVNLPTGRFRLYPYAISMIAGYDTL